jgi:hypothetical protein
LREWGQLMKDILLIGIVLFIIVALFGDGGLEISPELSPSLEAALDVNYAPDRSVTTTTIEQQVNNYIERQVEHETVIVNTQPAAVTMPSGGGSTIANGRPGGECMLVPGDVVVMQGSNGECQVLNNGQRFFISPAGTRSWLVGQVEEPTNLVQQARPQAPATTVDDRWAALVPLDELDTQQLQAAYLRNGGKLPLGFRLWTDKEQRDYLAARAESWR